MSFTDEQQILRLISAETAYDVIPFAQIYEDTQFKWTVREAQSRYEAGAQGIASSGGIINLSYKNILYWFVFNVENKTQETEWLLDFGRISSGKSGIPHKMYIYNATTGKIVYDSSSTVKEGQDMVMTDGSVIRLNLRPNQTHQIVMYMLPSDSMSLSFPLSLRPQTYNPIRTQHEFLSEGYFLLVLGGGIIFLMGVCLFPGGWIFTPFIVLFILKSAWFWLQNNFIVLPPMLLDWAPVMYTTLSSLLAIFSTWFFANLTKKEGEGSLLLIIVSTVLLLGFLMFAFVFPENTILRTVSLYTPYFITFLSIAFYCFGQGGAGIHGARFLGLTWLVWSMGMVAHFLCAFELVPFNIYLLQGEWYAMGAVLFLMMLSVAGRFEGIKQTAVQAIIRKAQKAQSIARLKQSKESADQARLLRVIEREREIMEELRQREAQRTEEMRQAKIAADEANGAKSAFLAVVSHEIRTPMTGIMGMIRLLQDTKMSQEQREFADTIKDSGDAMLALLNDILDFSKIEGGGMELEIVDFDITRLVHGVIRLMSGHANQKSIYVKAHIAPDVPQFVKGDPTRLRQVLLNLVGNAIKFTSEGGVTLHLEIDKTDIRAGEHPGFTPLKFMVEDTGIGISKDGQKNLFTPFAQADSSIARKFGGTGLGLAICKRLIEAMGSVIELSSIEGQGTKFFFTVFLAEGASDRAATEVAATDTAAQGKKNADAALVLSILIVDDNEINRKVIQGLIAREGHKSVVAENATDAIALAEHHRFDLILMDIELPDMSGVDATAIIRNNAKIAYRPHVAALTGNVLKEDVDHYIESGLDSHLAKPINPDKLRDLLGSLVGVKMLDLPPAAPNNSHEKTQGAAQNAAENFGSDHDSSQTSNIQSASTQPASTQTKDAEPMAHDMMDGIIPGSLSFDLTEEDLEDSSFDSLYHDDEENDGEHGDTPPLSVTPNAVQDDHSAELAGLNVSNPSSSLVEDSPVPSIDPKEIFDEPMLASLKKSLGGNQIKELLLPLFDKNDELVGAIESAFAEQNWPELMARAHEIKGMSGNFGLIKLSRLGGVLEKAVREGKTDPADFEEAVKAMPEASRLSKEVLTQWMNG